MTLAMVGGCRHLARTFQCEGRQVRGDMLWSASFMVVLAGCDEWRACTRSRTLASEIRVL
jgi:hypothetical protein